MHKKMKYAFLSDYHVGYAGHEHVSKLKLQQMIDNYLKVDPGAFIHNGDFVSWDSVPANDDLFVLRECVKAAIAKSEVK